MNNKIVAGMLILVFVGVVSASVISPTKWDRGAKLYNVYWDLMGEAGIQNGSIVNMTWVNSTSFKGNITAVTSTITTLTSTDIITASINTTGVKDFGRSAVAPVEANASGSRYYNTTSDTPCYKNATEWVNYNLSGDANRRVGCQ